MAHFPAKRRIFLIDDSSSHHDEDIRKKDYFLITIPGGVTGDIQGNDTNFHHPVKTIYCEFEMN